LAHGIQTEDQKHSGAYLVQNSSGRSFAPAWSVHQVCVCVLQRQAGAAVTGESGNYSQQLKDAPRT
jgi:hypothetical protein